MLKLLMTYAIILVDDLRDHMLNGVNNMVDCKLYCVTLDRAPTNDIAHVGVAMVLLFLQPALGGCIGNATRGGTR